MSLISYHHSLIPYHASHSLTSYHASHHAEGEATVDTRDEYGNTLLILAAQSGSAPMIDVLLERYDSPLATYIHTRKCAHTYINAYTVHVSAVNPHTHKCIHTHTHIHTYIHHCSGADTNAQNWRGQTAGHTYVYTYTHTYMHLCSGTDINAHN
jgi:ankyrin repeat protein